MLIGNNKPELAKGDELVSQIDALLPQTQCGQCNYPGCKPYAPERKTDAAWEEAILKAEERKDVTLTMTNVVLNCPIFEVEGAGALPGSKAVRDQP